MPTDTTPENPKQKLSVVNKLGYGAGDYAFNLYFQGAGLFLLYYYTDVLNISATAAGLIFMTAMIWDGITDPVMGFFANRTRTSMGKYRPYLIWGALPLAFSFFLMFWNPGFSGLGLIIYVYFTGIFFRTCYTVVSIPYISLSADMTYDSNERGSLAAYRMVFAVAGGLTVAILTKYLVSSLGAGNEAMGFAMVALIYGLLATLIFLFCFSTTSEKVNLEQEGSPSVSEVLWMLKKNVPFQLIAWVVMIVSATQVMVSKTLVYYFKYNLQNEKATGTGLLALLGTALIAVPLWAWISKQIGKRNVFLIGSLFTVAGYLLLYANTSASLKVVLLLIALIGFGLASAIFAFWAILPDTVEYGQWKTGLRSESMLFGIASLCQKVALGVGAGLLGLLLDLVGYQANVAQSAATLQGISQILTLIPMTGILLSTLLMIFYRLDRKTHQKIVAEIEQKKRE